MNMIRFEAPPLPHFISCGFANQAPGFKHLNRRNLGSFDLLVSAKGTLYMGEDDRHYEVPEGHALILRPDCHHYPTKASPEATDIYWLHFHTGGHWYVQEDTHEGVQEPVHTRRDCLSPQTFTISVPQFTKLRRPSAMYEDLDRLVKLESESHQPHVLWEQQTALQKVLRHLSSSAESQASSPSKLCARQAASYLRANYKNTITAQDLGEHLNFHPVYIARCMQKEFGCSPFEYLSRYRIEQAKLLMMRSDMSIARISEEVGFQHAAYFSTCFLKYEGLSPRSYRRRFS
jgi:AraC-like DNA-binding protein